MMLIAGTRIKAAQPAKFMLPELYQKAMELLESYRYRIQMRRFIMIDLFDKSVVEMLVKEGMEVEGGADSPAGSRD